MQVSKELWRKFFKSSLKNTSSITKHEKIFFRQLVIKGGQPDKVLYVHIKVQSKKVQVVGSITEISLALSKKSLFLKGALYSLC